MALMLRKSETNGRIAVQLEGPPPTEHHFPPRKIDEGVQEGWINVDDNWLQLLTSDGPVVYRITRPPGAYCVYCGERLGEGPAHDPDIARERRDYVARCSQKVEQSDPQNPAGYRVDNYYTCELDDDRRGLDLPLSASPTPVDHRTGAVDDAQSSMISYHATALCKGADEDMMLLAGDIVFPGSFLRWPNENGFRIWVGGYSKPDEAAEYEATKRFQIILGLLRSWRPDAGELQQERTGIIGAGSRRDPAGNQWVPAGPAVVYLDDTQNELRQLAEAAAHAIKISGPLHDALCLHGRANRTTADYYMISQYCAIDLASSKQADGLIAKTLGGISANNLKNLRKTANNLSPVQGGRKEVLNKQADPPWDVDECRTFVAYLLKQWIQYRGQ